MPAQPIYEVTLLASDLREQNAYIYSYLFSFFPPCILGVFMVIIIADNIIFSFLILYFCYNYVCLLILSFSVTTNPSIVSFCNKSELKYNFFPQQKGGDSSSCHQGRSYSKKFSNIYRMYIQYLNRNPKSYNHNDFFLPLRSELFFNVTFCLDRNLKKKLLILYNL